MNKSAYMVFKANKNQIIPSTVSLNGVNIPRVSNYKYLGINISDIMDIEGDTNRMLKCYLKLYFDMGFSLYHILFT